MPANEVVITSNYSTQQGDAQLGKKDMPSSLLIFQYETMIRGSSVLHEP